MILLQKCVDCRGLAAGYFYNSNGIWVSEPMPLCKHCYEFRYGMSVLPLTWVTWLWTNNCYIKNL